MLTLLEKIISFLLGGKATITIKNTKTGGRFTFEVIRFKAKNGKKEEEMPFIVKVLSGPNNESDFRRLGMIFPDGDSFRFVVPAKWEISKDAQSAKAFDWFFKRCMSGKEMPESSPHLSLSIRDLAPSAQIDEVKKGVSSLFLCF